MSDAVLPIPPDRDPVTEITTERAGAVVIRRVVLVSSDVELRCRVRACLLKLRWDVREAGGGAEALALLDEQQPEALLLDEWLPDLDVRELEGMISSLYPGVDLLRLDGRVVEGAPKSPRRYELLHALREAGEAPTRGDCSPTPPTHITAATGVHAVTELLWDTAPVEGSTVQRRSAIRAVQAIPGMIGSSEPMLELARLIRLVAPRSTSVLIEGETGTGKEIVAQALHQLSVRAAKPLVTLNCAAIPEALLEAELFGHTRGAFTGAVGSRTGRIEAAHGGTLFLDEIGELPLALQAKLLRFLEYGELQRLGENEVAHVDVRVLAATHQDLEQRASDGTFRLDLYHRLAVFPLEVPALRERMGDMPLLAEHWMRRVIKGSPQKRLMPGALEVLLSHHWPGNVRELGHVLERAVILAEENVQIEAEHIRYRRKPRV